MQKEYAAFFLYFIPLISFAQMYEISGSPYATSDAPLPEYIKAQAEKIILVDPNENAWGAYDARGKLIRWGIATTGAQFCEDIGRPCRTKAGNFRIYSLGDAGCYSSRYPVPGGGAPMPYCMYFNGGQALHGSDEVTYGNASHGCVRLHVEDARWLRYHFVEGPTAANHYRGTKVIVRPYQNNELYDEPIREDFGDENFAS